VDWLPESMMPVPQLDELNTWVMEGQVSILTTVTIFLLEFVCDTEQYSRKQSSVHG